MNIRKTKETKIHRYIVVMSGKGGVGKSTVSTHIATSIARKGWKVGILDADVTGPNIPKMMGVENKKPMARDKLYPVLKEFKDDPFVLYPIKIFSSALLLPSEDMPIVKRGDFITRMLVDSLDKIAWGKLDYLIVDTPPGTSDEIITILEYFKDNKLTKRSRAIIVTQPQGISLLDVKKAISLTKIFGIKIAGIVENMSGLFRGSCNELAEEQQLQILAKLKFNIEFQVQSDKGKTLYQLSHGYHGMQDIKSLKEDINWATTSIINGW